MKLTLYYTNIVIVDQQWSNGQSTGSFGHYEGSSWVNYSAPDTFTSFTGGSTQYFLADTNTWANQQLGTEEKYDDWNSLPDNLNFKYFQIALGSRYIAHRLPAISAVIQAQLVDGGVPGGVVNFIDPWVMDDNSDPKGPRNRGPIAIWHNNLSSPLQSTAQHSTTTQYRGVFPNKRVASGLSYYSIGVPSQQTINGYQTGAFLNWSVTGGSANLNDPTALQTGLQFTGSSTTTLTGYYKGLHLSNNPSAFQNNSQRKFVRTRDGWLHQVYESVGRVWLEESSDNGATWLLGNNGQPLDNGAGKCPSIDWHYNTADPNNTLYNAVVVVYQQQSGNAYTIEYAIFKYTNGSYVRQLQNYPGPLYTEPTGGDQYAATNANPNIAWGELYFFALAFERKSTVGSMQPGIYWRYGYLDEGGVEPGGNLSSLTLINGTTSGSTNASISLNKLSSDYTNFWIVYQQGSSSIYYVQLFCWLNGSTWTTAQPGNPVVMSAASGVKNYQPSIVQMPNSYDFRACWIRDWYGMGSMTPYYVNVVYWDFNSPSVYNCTGNMVNSVSLNIGDNSSNTYYAFAQNTNNSTWQNFGSNGSSTISLNTTGRYIQLSNGPSSASMYASSYYPVTLPYYFQTSNSFGQLQKTESGQLNIGRGAVLVKGDAQFCYSLKSLTVDKANIKFVDIPVNTPVSTKAQLIARSMYFPSLDSLNKVLLSEPFSISGSQTVTITEQGGFADTSKAFGALGSNGYIDCKLELIDNITNKIIAKIKDWKITSSSLGSCLLSTSSLDVHNLGAMTVRVKMTVSTNVDSLQGALMNEYGTIDKDAFAKLTMNQTIVLQAPETVTTYALSQNYPNPFNPSTQLSYSLPQAGQVSLVIYDVLGREVATLADAYQQTGRYTVTWNSAQNSGTPVSSGVYFARLRVLNDLGGVAFTKTTKLLLMK
jgi:hypothetical protein